MQSSKKTQVVGEKPAAPKRGSGYLRRRGHPANQSLSDLEQKAQQNHVAQQLAEGKKAFNEISQCLTALSETDPEKMAPIRERMKRLEEKFVEANQSPTIALNEQMIKEKQAIQKLLKSVIDKKIKNANATALHSVINTNLDKLKDHLLLPTQFDDRRIKLAKKIVKKESGANVGYTITNLYGTKFTVKQGKTVGNTLSEAFSSMVLSRIVQTSDPENKSSKTLIANAFLVIRQPEKNDKNLSIEQRCKNNLFAASEWSSGKSFVACHLFGLKKRKKRAGTTQAEDFEDLRKLNAACHLGLENIVTPTALIADFDLHTENFMLKMDEQNVAPQNKERVKHAIGMLEKLLEKNDKMTREDRMRFIIDTIKKLQSLGVEVYFHKIDHDSGFYRYADRERKVDFSSHQTAFIHREGIFFKTQPTLHIAEITGGTTAGLEQLLLSNQGIDRLLKISVESEVQIIYKTTVEFFDLLHNKAMALGTHAQERQAAEFYLLNEFYYHITEKHQPTPRRLTDVEMMELKQEIVNQLEKGTRLKVEDLHVQVYKCLTEKESKNELTPEERQKYTQQIANLTAKQTEEKRELSPRDQEVLTQTIEQLTLKLKKDDLIKHLKSLPHIEKAIRAETALTFR